ncbi:MAG: L-serine ammonia-lyase [Opitutales bacterium]
MRAAKSFASKLASSEYLQTTQHIYVDVYGSLALTGKGHGTDKAILNGLEGESPETVDPDEVLPRMDKILRTGTLHINGNHERPFKFEEHFRFRMKERLPYHANAMLFTARDADDQPLFEEIYYSIGGGFIVEDRNKALPAETNTQIPYPFSSAKELFALCEKHGITIAELTLANESAWRSEEGVRAGVLNIAQTMMECIQRGCHANGTLPGGLNVQRRAPALYAKLYKENQANPKTHVEILQWLNLYALAVNEENAAGGRIVTAPTNGAAGIIPATLSYYLNFCSESNEQGIIDFLLTASTIGNLYKKGASLSAAEVGCQGEVGVACSMAAGALAAVLGGTLIQVENAAEMAMEHNLGLTCDPIGGLVQIPCIERNAMGTVKAMNCAHFALMESGGHARVPLDKVIATMLETGKNMHNDYKETSLGGLARSILHEALPNC